MLKRRLQQSGIGSSDGVETPESAQFDRDVGFALPERAQGADRFRAVSACRLAVAKLQARLAREPVVGMRLQLRQSTRAKFGQVAETRGLDLAVSNLIDAARRAMH